MRSKIIIHQPDRPEKDKARIPESVLAHKYLNGLKGIEIGGAAHNQFGLNTENVDYTNDETTPCKQQEIAMCGETLKVDIVASGDDLPFADSSLDFVVSSHVIEHFWDPIKALREWFRVVRPGGYIYLIIPHPERTFDKGRPYTPIAELVDRHSGKIECPTESNNALQLHHSVWAVPQFLELCDFLNMNVVETQEVDDKGHNGFTIIIKK